MKYDYLIVGSGLFGSVFAYEAKKRERSVWLLTSVLISEEIYTAKRSKGSTYTNTAHIFSILLIKRYGSISTSLRSSIIILTHRLRFTRMNFTICLSI